MTGDETENLPEHAADAEVPAPAAAPADGAESAAVAPVELTAAEQAVPDFAVPEPPTFDDAGGDLPVPDAVTAEPVIPPPPVFEDERDAAASASRERPATRRAAAQRTQSGQPVAPAVSYVDVAPHAPPGTAEGNSYRGWTVAIYTGLAALFFGAIALMAFLGLSG